jgi:hypothetical protein
MGKLLSIGSKWQHGFNEENNIRQRGRTPNDGNISPFDELKTTFHWSTSVPNSKFLQILKI